MTRTTEDPPPPRKPGSPEESAPPAVPHSGEGANSAMDALKKKRIGPPMQGGDGEKKG